MNNNLENTNNGREVKAMEFSAQSVIYLNETRKWTIFLSILAFIFLGLLVIGSIFMSVIFNTINTDLVPFMGIAIGAVYLLVGVLYFFPVYYLYKFSKLSRSAIYEEDTNQLTLAFKYLKLHYKFIGILSIVMLSAYLIFFIIASVFGGLNSFV
ncbi:hypothetical protein ACT3CE_12170 [Marinifilum sp. RC60d5]|uniref:hypothetical protein n=1 Tax=Marinifilum sp. RC60d5 TaxID=3458414 RepID=UPI004036E222